jgi:hypothetical protein
MAQIINRARQVAEIVSFYQFLGNPWATDLIG